MHRPALAAAVALLLSGCIQNYVPPTTQGTLDGASLGALVTTVASENHVPPALLYAVLEAESGGNPDAVSRHGAMGLMQLMPATAQACGLRKPFDPQANLECGASYLSQLLVRFHNDVTFAVAAYNAGPGAVARARGVPPQSQAYVRRVLRLYALGVGGTRP